MAISAAGHLDGRVIASLARVGAPNGYCVEAQLIDFEPQTTVKSG